MPPIGDLPRDPEGSGRLRDEAREVPPARQLTKRLSPGIPRCFDATMPLAMAGP